MDCGTNTWGEGPNKGGKYVGEWKDDKRNGQYKHLERVQIREKIYWRMEG